MNTFTDFHTRPGSPGAESYYSIEEHAAEMDSRLAQMQESANKAMDSQTSQSTGRQTVKQHLAIIAPPTPTTDTLQQWERNLAGQKLLPHLPTFDWPSAEDIAEAQTRLTNAESNNLQPIQHPGGTQLLTNSDNKIVLPAADTDLFGRICAVAHQGHHGHVLCKETTERIAKYFAVADMTNSVKGWVDNCLQCIKLRGGSTIPRPMGHQLLAERPFEVIIVDFIKLPLDRDGKFSWALFVTDQLTRLALVVPANNCLASIAAPILLERWLSIFPDPTFLISDRGTHFTAKLFTQIAEIRGFEHHMTTPYSPWTHGGVERLGRQVLKSMRALLATMDRDERDWPAIAPVIQGCINKNLRVSSRGDKTPMQLLTGLTPKNGIDHIAWLGVDAELQQLTEAEVLAEMDDVHDALEDLWSTAVQAQHQRRLQNARARKVQLLPRINIGDLVLVAKKVPRTKLSMIWTGPHTVTGAVNAFSWITEPLGAPPGTNQHTAHVVRIRRFSNAELNSEVDVEALLRAARHDYPHNFVKGIRDHRVEPQHGVFQLKVRWVGWGAEGDTWEPIHAIAEDAPHFVEDYLAQNRDSEACERYLNEYFPAN
jgi:transposase InsO family protein